VVTIQPALLQQLFRQQEKNEEGDPEKLTLREHEVLKLVARGRDNDAIAAELHISKRTVNVHITNIKSKLNLANRAQITLYALSHGLLGLFTAGE
jgi:two-component system, NarL family, response regulator LiaR